MAASNLLDYYTKNDSRMTSSTKYKSRYSSNYNGKDFKYITNTKIAPDKGQLAPENAVDAGISARANRKLKFNLNMNGHIWGDKEYESNVTKYFDRLYSVYPDYELSSLCQYVFMVRPDCNILNKGKLLTVPTSGIGPNGTPAKDAFMNYMYNDYKNLLYCLTLSDGDITGHDFIPFLVGRVESLNLADYSLKDYKMNQPFTNYNLPYASHALESQTGGQFEIVSREDADLRVHKLFQA